MLKGYDAWLEKPYQDACEVEEAMLDESVDAEVDTIMADTNLLYDAMGDMKNDIDMRAIARIIVLAESAALTTKPSALENTENALIAHCHMLRNAVRREIAVAVRERLQRERHVEDRRAADDHAAEMWYARQAARDAFE